MPTTPDRAQLRAEFERTEADFTAAAVARGDRLAALLAVLLPASTDADTSLPLATPTATPPESSAPVLGCGSRGAGDEQRGTVAGPTVGAVGDVAGGTLFTSGPVSTPPVVASVAKDAGPEVSQATAEAAVAASPVVARVLAATGGRVEHVEPAPSRTRPSTVKRSGASSAVTAPNGAPSAPVGWVPSDKAVDSAGF